MSTQNVIFPFFRGFSESLKPIGLPVLRVVAGAIFILHGYSKVVAVVSGDGLGGLASGMIEPAGLPFPIVLAWLAMITEFFGGICIVLGLFTRLWAFLGAGMMILIVLFVRGVIFGEVANYSYRSGGYEYDLLLAAVFSLLFVYGAGNWALDNKMKKTF